MHNDQNLVRKLAQDYAELAQCTENQEHRLRCERVNDLQPQRPPVWIDEIPWHEFQGHEELRLFCQDPLLREMEHFFREKLFRWKYFRADMVISPYYPIHKTISSTGNGTKISDQILKTEEENYIVSHRYRDQLDTMEKLRELRIPQITANPEQDARRQERVAEVLGDSLPTRLCGTAVYHSPWDEISMLRGVEPAFIDIMEAPELIHATMERFTEIGLAIMEQYENLGLLDSQIESLHCTPPFTGSLAGQEGKVTLKNVWFRAMAQMFSSVSPAVFEEFEFRYMRRLAEKCGLVYYGCCEPLDNFLPILKQLPNLRKVGVSPWANQEKSAAQIGGNYVYARKSNPAFVGVGFQAKTIEQETRETIEICKAYNCPYEFVLKDISTVNHKLENLVEWSRTVQHTIDCYY